MVLDTGVVSLPLGFSVTPSAFVGQIHLPQIGTHQVSVPLLPSAGETETEVSLSSTHPDIVEVGEKTVIPAESRLALVGLTTKAEGSAVLKMQVGDAITRLRVTVGPEPPDHVPGVASLPVGVGVAPPGTLGTVYMKPGTEALVRLPLLNVPVDQDTLVQLESRHPNIAYPADRSATIVAGARVLEIRIIAKPGPGGTALTDLRVGDKHGTIQVIVGMPAPDEAPVIVSPVVGFEIKE
jgi:hypothetical protein